MRRREFITLAGGAVTAWPLAARAQQPAVPVVGALQSIGASDPDQQVIGQFIRGLTEAGYADGKNLRIEWRYGDFSKDLLVKAAADLVQRDVNVIFAPQPEAVVAARNATTSIPIVAVDLESDPLAKGYVKSLARPGGNMTGMFLDLPELSGKQLGLLKEVVPRLSRIAILGIPGLNAAQFAATETAVRALALEPEVMEVRVADDFEPALEAARKKHVEGLSCYRLPSYSSLRSKSARLL
jgi:putative tryptophan/tyrosine transport system substrate-binding protein